jgi:predicted phage baseplate assembly protein
VEDFFDSKAESRHYVVDRATGEVKFGDGVNGMVPPIGRDNIKASYLFGGGKTGNVEAYEVSTLKTPIAYVDKVANPWCAGGGADVEIVEDAMERGPWVFKHRNRAVTIEDFEWLARQASRDVARTKCMGCTSGIGTGCVVATILPKSSDDKPVPSFELKNVVMNYLSERCSNVISLKVKGPVYIEVSVSVDVYPTSMDTAPLAEREALDRLESFLHPLTGGTDGKGWEFGRLICLSDVYALLEGIAEIDHVENVVASMFGAEQEVRIAAPDALICSGEHQVTLKFEGACV